MKKSVRLFITGSVQGIFFRQFIKDRADRHNIKGYLRNLEDGRAEIFLEGEKERVEIMEEICRQGPPHGQIRSIEEKPESFQDFKQFSILRI